MGYPLGEWDMVALGGGKQLKWSHVLSLCAQKRLSVLYENSGCLSIIPLIGFLVPEFVHLVGPLLDMEVNEDIHCAQRDQWLRIMCALSVPWCGIIDCPGVRRKQFCTCKRGVNFGIPLSTVAYE